MMGGVFRHAAADYRRERPSPICRQPPPPLVGGFVYWFPLLGYQKINVIERIATYRHLTIQVFPLARRVTSLILHNIPGSSMHLFHDVRKVTQDESRQDNHVRAFVFVRFK
jgi:hypothetical protein